MKADDGISNTHSIFTIFVTIFLQDCCNICHNNLPGWVSFLSSKVCKLKCPDYQLTSLLKRIKPQMFNTGCVYLNIISISKVT